MFFSEAFDAMFRLCADSEANVQNAVTFLDNLVKVRGRLGAWTAWFRKVAHVQAIDLLCCSVSQSRPIVLDFPGRAPTAAAVQDIVTASPQFSVDAFIPKLRDYMRVTNPYK